MVELLSTKIVLIYSLVLLFYIPFIFIIRRSRNTRYARKRFARGIKSILENCEKDTDSVSQVLMLYKRLAEKYGDLNNYFRSATEMLEDLVVQVDTTNEKDFKELYNLEIPSELRQRMLNQINLLKAYQPYSSISSKQGNLLNMLKHSIDNANKDLAINTLSQLGDEMEVLEGNVRRQENRNRISFSISIIGVILTIFFGAISFIQFFK